MSSRKKACKKCTDAKARCDLLRPVCSRCKRRGFQCQYSAGGGSDGGFELPAHFSLAASQLATPPAVAEHLESFHSPQQTIAPQTATADFSSSTFEAGRDGQIGVPAPAATLVSPRRASRTPAKEPVLDFSDVQLVSTTDSSQIRNRWLESFLPSFTRRQKFLQPYTLQYLSVVLKSYPRQMLRTAGLPPFIHLCRLQDCCRKHWQIAIAL